MTRKTYSVLSLLLALGTAVPLAAQGRDTSVVPGFDGKLRWGVTREQINTYWDETPLSVRSERGVSALSYAPWQRMNWTAMVHDERGLVGFDAVLLPTLVGVECEAYFMSLTDAMRQSFPSAAATGGVEKQSPEPLCAAVKAGQGRAEWTWREAATGVESRVWIDRADGLVHLRMGTPFYLRWAGGSASASAPAPSRDETPARGETSTVRNAGITVAGFRAIRPGMTPDEVAAVIGRAGTRTSSTGATETYQWKGTSALPMIVVTFAEGRAIMSSQVGLHRRATATPITLAAFNRLRQGMTYDEAVAALGSQGAYAGFTSIMGTMSESYLWWGRPMVSQASASFTDGKLSNLLQSGLN